MNQSPKWPDPVKLGVKYRFPLAAFVILSCTLLVYQCSRLHDKRSNLELRDVLTREPARENSISTRRARVVYVGDSRTRHMYGAHLRSLGLDSSMHSYYYSDASCKNNSYRYLHEDACSKAETSVAIAEQQINYRACWRTDQECFQQLSGSVSSAEVYLQMTEHENIDLFLNLGLHDVVYKLCSPAVFLDRMRKLFSTLSRMPNLKVTWLAIYPLLPPQPDKVAKFPNFEELNTILRSVTNQTNQAALAYNIHVFDIAEKLTTWKANYSADTVHLKEDVDDYLFMELANNSIETISMDPLSLSKLPGLSDDLSCGNQNYTLPGANQSISIVFMGGSVTSDGKYIRGFKSFAEKNFQWITSIINLGEAGTGSLYHSLCWKQTSHGFGRDLASARFVIVEFCANDFDLHATSLRRLLLELLTTPSNPTVLYYCHLSPKSRMNSLGKGGLTVQDRHWELAKKLGVIAIRDKLMIDMLLKRDESFFFRDAVHLNDRGGSRVGGRLAEALKICASKGHTVRQENFPPAKLENIVATRARCFTSLGPPESRNIHALVNGWEFVQTKHISAPNGKNGYETTTPGACLHITLNISCPPVVTLFHLASSSPDMGDATVSMNDCVGYSQLVGGRLPGATITRGRKLSLPQNCCSTYKNRTISLCTEHRHGKNSTRFRMIAIATE